MDGWVGDNPFDHLLFPILPLMDPKCIHEGGTIFNNILSYYYLSKFVPFKILGTYIL